jgi:hypothetical protein
LKYSGRRWCRSRRETIFLLSILKLVVQVGEFFLFVLIVLELFFEAFQRSFAPIFFLVVGLNVVESCWDDLFLCIIVDTWDICRMIIRVRKSRGGIDQAKVIWGESVTYLTCACVEGVAFNAILHANGADILSEMLLGIAYDLLRHVIS